MTDKKLTDSEIVKALECCRDIDIKCETCQLWTDSECTKVLHQATIDLINRLQEENENYSKNNQQMTSDILKLYKELEQAKAENERLKTQLYLEKYTDVAKRTIKAEAYKEFAERLTDRIADHLDQSLDNPDGNNYFITDVYTDIDKLLKELVGEDK